VSLGGEAASIHMNLHRHCDVMRSAVQGEDTCDLNGGIAGGRNRPLITLWRKCHLGIVRNIQHVRVHLLVPARVAAVPASGRNNNRAGDLGSREIEIDRSALHVKTSIDVVSGSSQRKRDLA